MPLLQVSAALLPVHRLSPGPFEHINRLKMVINVLQGD